MTVPRGARVSGKNDSARPEPAASIRRGACGPSFGDGRAVFPRRRGPWPPIRASSAPPYWAAGIPRALVERSLANSLCFGLYERERQIGLARVITDRATFAYLCDVFVLEEERGRGRFLMECVHAHPELAGLRRWLLVTRDAHGLYERFGWRVTPQPGGHMEIVAPDGYRPHPRT